jgi:hypothetical protein
METREEILKELREIAPQLSQLPKENLYVTPDGYFTTFTGKVLERIALGTVKQELNELAPALSELKKQTEQSLPADYFKNFSAGLLQKIRVDEVGEELRAIAPTLSSLPKINAYKVPAGYFGTFAKEIVKEVAAGEARPESAVPGWLGRINIALDGLAAAMFKPAYSFAMAGGVAVMVIVAMVVLKPDTVQQPCATDDLLCMLETEKKSSDDLDAYFSSHADEFSKSVLDVSTDDKKLENRNKKGELSLDEYMFENISDEELNNAIL